MNKKNTIFQCPKKFGHDLPRGLLGASKVPCWWQKPAFQPVILIRDIQDEEKAIFVMSSPDIHCPRNASTLSKLSRITLFTYSSTCDAWSPLLGPFGRDDFRSFAIWPNLPFHRVTVTIVTNVQCHQCPPVDDESPSCRRPFPCVRHNAAPINWWTSGHGSGRISENCLKTWEVMLTTLVVSLTPRWSLSLLFGFL